MMQEGIGGLRTVTIRDRGCKAEVYLHGAHVTSFQVGGDDVIFVSKQAIFKPPKAIRGGIPICFPQFGDMGPCKSQHGFARNVEWTLEESTTKSVTLALTQTDGNLNPDFPHPFKLQMHLSIADGALEQKLVVDNIGASPMEFTTALHTYFNTSDITKTSVRGLKGVEYLDSLQQRNKLTEAQEEVVFKGEVDRIYCGVPDQLDIVDAGAGKTVHIHKSGFADAVVWNPYIEKSAGMADFGDEEWKQMVCVEVAQAGSGPIFLKAGQSWTGTQILSVEKH